MTARNFGIQSRQPTPWGHSGDRLPASLGNYAPSDSILISPRAPFKRGNVSQALIDILALGSLALLICSAASAVGILGYVFYLKFLV